MFDPTAAIHPPWSATVGGHGPAALTTTRHGGISVGLCATLNLGERSGDDPEVVERNRERVAGAYGLPARPTWLHQVHGATPVRLHGDRKAQASRPRADASWTSEPGVVCAVLTADCLPVVIADHDGTCVAVVHAGWRGLAHGILEATVAEVPVSAARLHAWLGPAIGPRAFAVGNDVREAFRARDRAAESAFRVGRAGGWLADLYELARQRLLTLGIGRIAGGGFCTWTESRRFYSHRRDGPQTGRMATLAWLPAA